MCSPWRKAGFLNRRMLFKCPMMQKRENTLIWINDQLWLYADWVISSLIWTTGLTLHLPIAGRDTAAAKHLLHWPNTHHTNQCTDHCKCCSTCGSSGQPLTVIASCIYTNIPGFLSVDPWKLIVSTEGDLCFMSSSIPSPNIPLYLRCKSLNKGLELLSSTFLLCRTWIFHSPS